MPGLVRWLDGGEGTELEEQVGTGEVQGGTKI